MINKYNKAFTLIELSIVIVIIGLLVAGVLTGKDLIRASELKTAVNEVIKYKSALQQFDTLYSGLPGDITDATSYWSTSANGDGNGQIAPETSNEAFRAMQQLALANLIDGTYSGTSKNGGASDVLVPSTNNVSGNIGALKINGAGIYVKCCSTTDYSRSLTFNNHVNIFKPSSTAGKRDGIVTPIEALSIDGKMDDGIPDTGFIGGSGVWDGAAYSAGNCYTGTGSSSSYYSADSTKKTLPYCQMMFAYDW